MAASTNRYTNLLAVPSDISIEYFQDADLSKRAKERGYNFFTNGYVHGLKLVKTSTETMIDVGAKCYRSMRKSETPHIINLTIDTEKKNITERHCSCKAGVTGTCSHSTAVIYQLSHYKNLGMTDVPSELACTSMPQQWHKPRGPKIEPEPVTAMVFAKPNPTPRKKRPVHSSPLNFRIPDITSENIKQLKVNPASKGTPLEYLLHFDDLQMTQTNLGNVQLGSMLPFQLKHYRSVPVTAPNQLPCGDTTFPRKHAFINEDTLDNYKDLNNHFLITYDDAVKLERSTINQASSTQWINERINRVTASQFAKICKRKKEVTSKFVATIFAPSKFCSEATSYGNNHESRAKQVYIQKNPNHHIHDCGLVVNPQFSFLAASPDGKICIDGETGILEIKCPYSARDMQISEAIANIPNFCLKEAGGSILLLKSHEYFYQIQGQLMVTGAEFCIFVVYTKKDLYVKKIEVDKAFINQMFCQLSTFYENNHPAF